MKQGREASKGVVAAPWNREGNMGTPGHHACQLSLLVQGRRYVLVIDIKLLLHMHEIVCVVCGNFGTKIF